MPILIGLDLSLTGTGIADITIPHDSTPVTVTTHTIVSTGHRTDTLPMRVARIRKLRNTIIDRTKHADLVTIEAPAFSRTMGSMWDRAGLWHHVIGTLDHLGIPYAQAVPQKVKQLAAGKGNADKTAVAAGMVRMWGDHATPGNDNEFDALALATLGAIHLARHQLPVRVLERHLEVVSCIDWPTQRRYT